VEEVSEKAGFVRTHRGFIVNPQHVKLIRKSEGGYYFADLDMGGENGIPVSRKYYDSVTSVL
jgi:DNA-binding LytR/AlgR family response regulator